MAWTPRFEGIILWWVFLGAIMKLLVAYRMDNLSISRERLWLFKNRSALYIELISWQIKGFHSGADEKFFWNKTPCRFLSS